MLAFVTSLNCHQCICFYLKGPLWRQIRGLGLSYGYRMQIGPLTNSIVFILAKSTHIFKAFQKAKEITVRSCFKLK